MSSKNSHLLRVAGLTVAFACVAIAGAQTAAVSTSPSKIQVESLNLDNADLEKATQALAAQTGLRFLLKPSATPYGRVTLHLTDITADDAIRYICESAGAYYKQDENGVFVISQVPPQKETTLLPLNIKATDKKVFEKIHLLHADPRTIYEQVTDTWPDKNGPIFDMREDQELKQFVEQGTRPDAVGPRLTPMGSHYASPIVGSSQVSEPLTGSEAGNQISLPNEAAGQIGGGGGGIGGGGGLGGGGGQGGLGGGGGAGGQGGQQQVPQLQGGQGLVPDGIDQISYDPSDNSIFVEGTADAIRQLRKIVSELDVEPKQVQVQIQFITTSSSLSSDLGFDWLYQRGTILAGNTPGSFTNAGDPIFLNYANGNVTTRLRTRLLQAYGTAEVSSILRTLNNEPASINNFQRTFIEITTVTTQNGFQTSSPTIQQITAFSSLGIKPRINGDGTITVRIRQNNQTFGQLKTLPDGQQIPDILGQSLDVYARVKNGETIVLGGGTNRSDQSSQNKFPILGDLPIIGQFFRTKVREKNDSELLIFVTPTVVTDQDTTSAGSGI